MKNINVYLVFFFSFLSLNIFSQTENRIATNIQKAKQAGIEFVDLRNLFEIRQLEKQGKYEKYIDNFQAFRLNKMKLRELKSSKNLITNIPYNGETIVIELQEVNSKFNSYHLRTSSGKKHESNKNQKHYRGIINGTSQSIVALSFFDNEVSGFLSSNKHGTINIGKLKKDSAQFIYSDNAISSIVAGNSIDGCYTNSAKQNSALDEIYSRLGTTSNLKSATAVTEDGNHLNLYIEVDNDIYNDFGSRIANVENYVTGLFNQVATLYANENIFLQLSEIFIWDTPDAYAANINDGLADFVDTRVTFDGDLALLLSYIDGDDDPDNTANAGGIANGIGGLCVIGDADLSPHAHIALFPEFEEFPTFSRQVKVVTHEMGHVLGSRHTHACVWNGTNTAIDGCGDCMEETIFPETCPTFADCCEGCADPGNPAVGGTIMSYCDRTTVGIDFMLGFGEQPGDVIRNFIVAADCLDCNITIANRAIDSDAVINACGVEIENVTIENNANVEINSTGNVIINGIFEAELGTTLEIKNE